MTTHTDPSPMDALLSWWSEGGGRAMHATDPVAADRVEAVLHQHQCVPEGECCCATPRPVPSHTPLPAALAAYAGSPTCPSCHAPALLHKGVWQCDTRACPAQGEVVRLPTDAELAAVCTCNGGVGEDPHALTCKAGDQPAMDVAALAKQAAEHLGLATFMATHLGHRVEKRGAPGASYMECLDCQEVLAP